MSTAAPQPHHLNYAVPIPAITWILHNDCVSNVYLSTLSNVCRSWREVCCTVLVAEAISLSRMKSSCPDISLMCSMVAPSLSVVMESEVKHRNSLAFLTSITSPDSTVRKLFLCDMARELIVQQANRALNPKRLNSRIDGNFCLAWFAPSGIQITSVPLDACDDTDDDAEDLDEFKFDFARVHDCSASNATKADAIKGIQNGGKPEVQRPRKKPSKQSNSLSQRVSCCHEWRGYRHSMEVLAPFGYATAFVRDVLDASVKFAFGHVCSTSANDLVSNMTPNRNKPTLTRSASELSQNRLSQVSSLKYNPTFSVRGATLARSEGYCLCLDEEYIQFAQSTEFENPSHSTTHKVPQCIDDWLKHSCEHFSSNEHTSLYPYERSERHREKHMSPRQRAKKRSILARALLPRLVTSTRRKCPILHRFAEEDANGNKGHRDRTIHDPHSGENANSQRHLPWEKRQRAVQFLNCDRSQAVKLITPPFHCGGVQAPITIFIVAITTEDGCFVSGRKSRFEFGHMYPLNNRDMMIDMSPVCIATGSGGTEEDITSPRGKQQVLKDAASSSSSDHDDDEDESCNSDRSTHCLCNFDSCDPFHQKGISIDDPTEDCIHRGKIGPGLWHCYVAVFDGKSSFIRVDGQEEPQQTSHHYGMESGTSDADNPKHAGRFVGSSVLDGLTIGSDHHFDMSLCYGEIGGECGQGAISELAVFKGRLDQSDITTLENYLMKKHGILSVSEQADFISNKNATRPRPIRIMSPWEEDEWRRQAHALIAQRPPWDLVGEPVPLRVAANHSSVAWQRVDEITGMPMRVSRIGHKTGNGSSDW